VFDHRTRTRQQISNPTTKLQTPVPAGAGHENPMVIVQAQPSTPPGGARRFVFHFLMTWF